MKTFENTKHPEKPNHFPFLDFAKRLLPNARAYRWLLLLGSLLWIAPTLTACQNRPADAKKQENTTSQWRALWKKRESRAKPVHATTLQNGTITSLLASTTTLTAEEDVSIIAQVTGLVEVVNGLEGRSFRRGGLLARLSNPYLKIAYDRAKSEANKLRVDLDRQQKLLKKGYVSKETVETLRFQFEQAENQLQKAQEDLNNLRIYSTIGGVVTQRLIQKGAWVIPQQKAFQVENPRSLVAHIAAPERYLPRLKTGLLAFLQAEALGPKHTISGKVIRIAPAIDPKTGTVQVTIGSLHPLHSLRSGMFVSAQIVLERRIQVPLVPKVAVSYHRNKAYVFRLKAIKQPCLPAQPAADCEAERVYIEKGLENTNWIEVRAGVKFGDPIIMLGQEGLRPKRRVRVMQWQKLKPPTAS